MSIFSDQYAAMARQMEFSDPRTQELLMLLAKAITGQTYNSLSNDWQTGMNFIGRAIVNSPLGSMAGLSGNNMFSQIHAGVAGAGGIPMMGSGDMYMGHSFGSGANSLSMAYGLTTQATTMASDLGLSGNTVAGYIGSALAQRGFRFGDVTVRQFDTSKALNGAITDDMDPLQQRQLRNQAIALAVFENYRKVPANGMSDGSMRDHAANIHAQLKSLDPPQREQAVKEAMQTLGLEGEAPNLSNALLASTEQFIHAGGNLTAVSSRVTEDLKRGLTANAENIRKLTKALGTDNFAELEQVARTLHMGSLRNEQDANRIREHMLDAERTAMTTGRTVQEVLGVQGNMVRILAPVYGGEEFVNQRALMSSMDRFEVYERNRRTGHDYRTQQEYIADELAITSNAAKNMQGLHGLSYAYTNYEGMFTGTAKTEYERIMAAINNPNTTAEDLMRLNREARQLLKSMGMDSDQFYRAALANSPLSESLFTNRYSEANAQTYLGRLGNAAFGGARNRASISTFAKSAAALFGRDTSSLEEVLHAMEQKDDAWNSYLNGLGLSQADMDMLTSMRNTWNATGTNKDAIRFVVHSMQREANLDNTGVVARAQQDQAFISSFLAKQSVNLHSGSTGDNAVLLGLFGEGGAISDEAALVYGMTQLADDMTNQGVGRFSFGADGSVVGIENIWNNTALRELFGVTSKEDAERQGITTQAGFTRRLADLQSRGSIVAQSSDGTIFVGTREDAQKARQSMTSTVDATQGLKVVRGMFAGANVSNFSYNSTTGAYSFSIDGKDPIEGAAAMQYLHQRVIQDPTLRKELEFKADASNGFDEATRTQAQQTLTAIRALDAARSFNFQFVAEEGHRGTLDWLFQDKRGDNGDLNALVNSYLANPASNAWMSQRLDFIDAIRGRSKDELTALGYLDASGNWTQLAEDVSGVANLKGKSADFDNDRQLQALMRAGRADGPAESILQILSRIITGDRLKVTST